MSSVILTIILVVSYYFLTKKSKFGINLKRVFCPQCNLKQPIFRIPKGSSQLLYGGYTCTQCKTEMDKYGVKLKKE